MRMFDQKGQIRIIEAFFAIGVVFSAFLISATFPSQPDLAKQKSLANLGTQALQKLDANGMLGNLITQQNWTCIQGGLDALLPVGVSYNLTIYDDNMHAINSQAIQNTNLLGSETVSVQHLCVTQTPNVQFFILLLQLAWRT